MINEKNVELDEYSKGLDLFSEEFNKTYEEGLKDGTIKRIENIRTFYYSTTHAMLELCKKLSSNAKIVKQDDYVKGCDEILFLAEIILSALKN